MKKDHLTKLGSPPARPPGPLPKLSGKAHHAKTSLTSKREATHRGHSIVITTSYAITVDGEPLRTHVEVDDLGRVHYHGLPNYNFRSAIDMVKAIIDAEPGSFPRSRRQKGAGAEGSHHGGGGH